MNFLLLAPIPPPPVPGYPFWGGWGQNFFVYCGRCVCIWTWGLKNVLLVYGPPNPCPAVPAPDPGNPQPPPPPPHMAPCQ